MSADAPGSTWYIRHATPADVSRLKELGVRGWETTYADFVEPHNREYGLNQPFWELATLERIVRDPHSLTLVAQLTDSVVAFLTVEPLGDGRVELTRFYVDPDTRRGGIGSTLFNAALDWSRDRPAPAMLVNVFADNAIGRAFYERAGFQLTSLDPFQIGDQVVGDAWYELDLTSPAL